MARLFHLANEELPSIPECLLPNLRTPLSGSSPSRQGQEAGSWRRAELLRLWGQLNPALHPWPRPFPYWILSFLICEMGTGIGSVLQGWEAVNQITQAKVKLGSWHRSTLSSSRLADDLHFPVSPLETPFLI